MANKLPRQERQHRRGKNAPSSPGARLLAALKKAPGKPPDPAMPLQPARAIPDPPESRESIQRLFEGRERRLDFETWFRHLLMPYFEDLWNKYRVGREGHRRYGQQRLAIALLAKVKERAERFRGEDFKKLSLDDQGIVAWAQTGISRKVIRRLMDDVQIQRTLAS